ncbi:MAG: helix-turn-helix transcriptional regulator [Firmicutes bacterium]|nr:helix-turn-helix transcriptional regulator [Bacillota bacterium]
MDRVQRFGKNIKYIRASYGEAQEKLGEAIGVEKNTVSNYENGKCEPHKDFLRNDSCSLYGFC